MVSGSFKRVLRRTLSILLKSLIFLALFAILYLTIGYIASQIVVDPHGSKEVRDINIYLKSNGKHIDLVLPVTTDIVEWRSLLPCSNNLSKENDYDWVAFGWGDKGFFIDMPTWDDLTFSLAFKAAFWLSTTAMHITYYKEIQEDELCIKVAIGNQEYKQLIAYILKKFKRDERGEFIFIPTDATYGESDAFYEAKGRYNLFYSCNSWANYALKSANQKYLLWTFFDKPLLKIYNREKVY